MIIKNNQRGLHFSPLWYPVAAIVLFGFITITSQVVFIREMMIILGGSELSIGIVLGMWLLWTAAGSYCLSRWGTNGQFTLTRIAVLLSAQALLLPLTIFAIRVSRVIFGITVGELVDIAVIISITFFVLAPFCFVSGALFPVCSRALYRFKKDRPSEIVGNVYILEGIGACLGGIILHFIFLTIFSNTQIGLICAYLCILTLLLFILLPKRKLSGWIIVIILTVFSTILIRIAAPLFDTYSYSFLWKGYDVLRSTDTIYGNLVVTEYNNQTNFFVNGLLLFASGDPQTVEEAIHLPFLQHPNPTSALLIGGGINGGIKQCLKHSSVRRIDYVELDPEVIRLGKEYLSEEELPHFPHPKINLYYTDGRQYIKTTNQRYSVIIITLPDPSNAQINRFFTYEFFKEVRRILQPGGILAFSLTSSENYINDQLAEFLKCIYNTLRKVYNEVAIIPGNTVHFFASQIEGILTEDSEVLLTRLKERNIQNLFVNEYFLPYRMSHDRFEYFKMRVFDSPVKTINTDLKPVGYFYQIVLWSTKFSQNMRKFFIFLAGLHYKEFLIFLFVASIFLLFYIKGTSRSLIAAVCTVGFSEISIEIILITGFQMMFGYIYNGIAMLLACFMGGLAFGGWIGLRYGSSYNAVFSQLKILQFLLSVFPLIILFPLLVSAKFTSTAVPIFSNALFPVLMLTTGFQGGYHFQLSNTLYLRSAHKRRWGSIYALDLFGSCLGAFVVSAICLPVLGIAFTCVMLVFLNFFAYWGLRLFPPRF